MTNVQQLIQSVERADSPPSLVESVRALAASQSQEAIPTLIAVLGYNNPGAALAAVDGLIALGESAVMPLLEELDDYNYGARAYSIRALAAIADPRALDVLVAAATTDFAPSVRRAAAKGLGNLHWHKLTPERVEEALLQALQTLQQIARDTDWVIRYAAVVGLQDLALNTTSTTVPIQNQLEQLLSSEADNAVRSRVMLARQRLHEAKATA